MKTKRKKREKMMHKMEKKQEERRRFPGAQVARPEAEQWEMAEELHMMQCPPLQCHDSEESRTNTSLTRFTPQKGEFNPTNLVF